MSVCVFILQRLPALEPSRVFLPRPTSPEALIRAGLLAWLSPWKQDMVGGGGVARSEMPSGYLARQFSIYQEVI